MPRTQTIYVYRIDLDSTINTHEIPQGARFLHTAAQHGAVAMWYEIPDREAPLATHRYELYGTGDSIPNDGMRAYLGTTLHYNGTFVIHVYEAKP